MKIIPDVIIIDGGSYASTAASSTTTTAAANNREGGHKGWLIPSWDALLYQLRNLVDAGGVCSYQWSLYKPGMQESAFTHKATAEDGEEKL